MTVVSRSLTTMIPAAPAAIALRTMAFANCGISDHFTTQTRSFPVSDAVGGKLVRVRGAAERAGSAR